MKISGQIALVTGGGSGLGRATAIKLKELGATVAIADRNQKAVDEVVAQSGVIGFGCDVTSPDSVAQALAQLKQRAGAPRIVINCAGVGSAKRILGKEGPQELEEFTRVVHVNLIGTFNVMRLAAAEMAALEPLDTTERGVIINTSSIAAFEGQIGQAGYAASKGGVAALTLPAAREFARIGVRVLAIAPGIFMTPLLLGLPEKAQQALAEATPFPKRLGAPEEFAALAMHMVENVMLNGELVRLDGATRLA